MATPSNIRYVLLNTGQSNASIFHTAKLWEDANPLLALRNPKHATLGVSVRRYTQGTYSDLFELPSPEFGARQRVSIKATATKSVRYLKFHNPTHAYVERARYWPVEHWNPCYPGTFRVQEPSAGKRITSTRFQGIITWQFDPTGIVLTRRRTCTTHTIASIVTLPGNEVVVTEPFAPPLEAGEEFSYPLSAAVNSATADVVTFHQQFGGHHEPGGLLEAMLNGAIGSYPNLPLAIPGGYSTTFTVFGGSGTVFDAGGAHSFEEGQAVELTNGGGTLPSPLALLRTYYVRLTDNTSRFGLSSTPTGPLIPATGAGTGTHTATRAYALGAWEVTFTVDGPRSGKCFCRERAMFVGRKIRFRVRTGTLPADLATGVPLDPAADYYVARLETPSDITPSSHYQFYISSSPDGPEIVFTTGAVGDFHVLLYPNHTGTLAGLTLRCLTGANVGEVRALADTVLDSGVRRCQLLTPFSLTPQLGDTFTIEPPAVDDEPVPFDKWAYFLPASPFAGSFDGIPAGLPVVINPGTGQFTCLFAFYNGARVRLYRNVYSSADGTLSGQSWPTGVLEGKDYYVVNVTPLTFNKEAGTTFRLSATYDGPAIAPSGATGTHWIHLWDTTAERENPFPPGFNEFSQESVPQKYQPYRGAARDQTPVVESTSADAGTLQPVVAHHFGTAQRLSEYLGHDIYVVSLAVGGTSLAHREMVPGALRDRVGWQDDGLHESWAPVEDTGLFARWSDTLDAALLAAKREGVELRVIGWVYVQAEHDSDTQDKADRYLQNVRGFKRRMRQLIVDKGLWPGSVESIPMVHPKEVVAIGWPFAETVNQAITDAADEDPYAATVEVEDFAPNMWDGQHFRGDDSNTFSRRIFEALVRLMTVDENVLRVCNLALTHIGGRTGITSIDPPDGSTEADLCARFYREARDAMFERFPWDFTMRSKALIATTNDRTDYANAFLLPNNFGGIIALGDDLNAVQNNRGTKIPYAIEINSVGERVLYCSQDSVVARYKMARVSPALFSASFIQGCSLWLAGLLAGSYYKGKDGLAAAERLFERAKRAVSEAEAIDSNQRRDMSQPDQLGWRR